MEEISDGVKILCDRMESNPEDFSDGPLNPNTFDRSMGKFYYDGREIESLAKGEAAGKENFWYLNETEKAMLVKAYVDMRRRWATQRVVEKLLAEPEPEVDVAKAIRNANRPLTKAQMVNDALQLMNKSFDETYAKDHNTGTIKYKALGRYSTGWDGNPVPDPWKKNK